MASLGLSVVIPFYSKDTDLSATLQSLEESYERLLFKQEFSLEILVINDSSPISPRGSRRLPIRQIDLPKNHGVGYARNEGIRESKFKHFLCLDSDILVPPDFFERVVEEISSERKASLVQGVVSSDILSERPSLFQRYQAIFNFADAQIYQGNRSLLCSGCFLSTKEFFSSVGYFDETFAGSGGEEFEILRRLPPGSIQQSTRIEVYHQYEGIFARLRKLWRRSRNYAAAAAFNPNFPTGLKLAGILRVAFAALAFLSLFGLFFVPVPALAALAIAYFGLLLADGGAYARYFFKKGGTRLLFSAPFFLFLEYFVAALGALLHPILAVFIRKKYVE